MHYLFFSTLYQPGSYLESRFLPTIQSLEVLSRETFADSYTTDDVFKKTISLIVGAIPSETPCELTQSITDRLRYANEFTLRHRLKSVIERMEEQTRDLFCVDYKSFVSGIVNTRNYLTHYSSSSGKVLQKLDMHWATVKMRLLMTILLLKRAGLDEALIRSAVNKHHRLSHERAVWKDASEIGTKLKKG